MEQAAGSAHAPWHLSIIGSLAFVWNGFGAFDYLMKQTENPAYLAGYTEQQRAYFDSFSFALEAFWALGVWAALLGSFLLLLRNGLAPLAFAVAIVGLLGSSWHQFAVLHPPPELMTIEMTAMIVLVWATTLALFYYSRVMKRRGLIGR